MRIGIFPNLMKESSISLVQNIVSLCKENGCEYYVLYDEEESGHAVYTGIEKEHLLSGEKIYDRIELAFVLGGDGTILKSARHFASRGIPVCGINLGSLGFLYEVEAADLPARFTDILAGRYFKEERIMLAGELEYADGMIQRLPDALNDIVIGHGNVGKLVRVDMSINGYFVQQYPGDGIVVSTPTGSTGYTFSAGGPIVPPHVKGMMVTPICPHLLLKIPLVLSDEDRLSFSVRDSRNVVRISVDGMTDYEFACNMILHIRKSTAHLDFIRFDGGYFYANLFKKMRGAE